MENKFKSELEQVNIENANPKQKKLLEQTRETYGTIPTMQMIMANNPALLQTYMDGMDLFRSGCGFSPVEQEVAFMVISRQNECYPCLMAHGLIAEKQSNVPIEIINAIKVGESLMDKKLNSLVEFIKALIMKRGFVSNEDITCFLEAGYQEPHILSLIHALSMKILSNYTNHIFQAELNEKAKKVILKLQEN